MKYSLCVACAIALTFFAGRSTVLIQDDPRFQKLQSELLYAKINGYQAVLLLQRPTWYWVAPGEVSSEMSGNGIRVDYNSGIGNPGIAAEHTLAQEMLYSHPHSHPHKLRFVRNDQHSTNTVTVCGGLLVVVDED